MIFRALQILVIVVALPKAIPRSSWLIYLAERESFSANCSCVYSALVLANFIFFPIFFLRFFSTSFI